MESKLANGMTNSHEVPVTLDHYVITESVKREASMNVGLALARSRTRCSHQVSVHTEASKLRRATNHI
jgi:hypothetical protein